MTVPHLEPHTDTLHITSRSENMLVLSQNDKISSVYQLLERMYQSYAGDGRKRHSHIVLGIMFATGIYVLYCEFLGDKIAVA